MSDIVYNYPEGYIGNEQLKASQDQTPQQNLQDKITDAKESLIKQGYEEHSGIFEKQVDGKTVKVTISDTGEITTQTITQTTAPPTNSQAAQDYRKYLQLQKEYETALRKGDTQRAEYFAQGVATYASKVSGLAEAAYLPQLQQNVDIVKNQLEVQSNPLENVVITPSGFQSVAPALQTSEQQAAKANLQGESTLQGVVFTAPVQGELSGNPYQNIPSQTTEVSRVSGGEVQPASKTLPGIHVQDIISQIQEKVSPNPLLSVPAGAVVGAAEVGYSILHPKQTVQGILYAVNNPYEVGYEFGQNLVQNPGFVVGETASQIYLTGKIAEGTSNVIKTGYSKVISSTEPQIIEAGTSATNSLSFEKNLGVLRSPDESLVTGGAEVSNTNVVYKVGSREYSVTGSSGANIILGNQDSQILASEGAYNVKRVGSPSSTSYEIKTLAISQQVEENLFKTESVSSISGKIPTERIAVSYTSPIGEVQGLSVYETKGLSLDFKNMREVGGSGRVFVGFEQDLFQTSGQTSFGDAYTRTISRTQLGSIESNVLLNQYSESLKGVKGRVTSAASEVPSTENVLSLKAPSTLNIIEQSILPGLVKEVYVAEKLSEFDMTAGAVKELGQVGSPGLIGLGQTKRQKVMTTQGQELSLEVAPALKSSQKVSQRLELGQEKVSKQSPQLKNEVSLKLTPDVAVKYMTEQVQKQQLRQEQKQKQELKQQPKEKLTPRPNPKGEMAFIPPIVSKASKLSESGILQVRKGGKWLSIDVGDIEKLNKEGQDIVGRTLRASYRIKEKGQVLDLATPVGFVPSKKEKGVIVEPGNLRLNTKTEVQEIRFAKRKKFGGLRL